MTDSISLVSDLIRQARAAGADAADAVLVNGTSLSVASRQGKIEHLERSEGRDLGLRVFVGKRSAIVSSTSHDPAGFASLVERAVAMAKVVPEDQFAGLAETWAPPDTTDLDMADPAEPAPDVLSARAAAAEDAAYSVSGVTNSEGGEAGYGRNEIVLVTSAGFAGRRVGTSHSISATALAGAGTDMQRDYDYHSTVYFADLDDPVKIGKSAGERAVARLNPTRPKTAKMPVVYDPRVAGSLLGHLTGAINGAGVARGTSFLKDKLGQRIFGHGINIHDDPRRVRGLRSRTFRRRGHANPGARADRGRGADDVAAGEPVCPATRYDPDRACDARHQRAALGGGHQSVFGCRGCYGRRADGRHQGGSLHYRNDRHGSERCHRRL